MRSLKQTTILLLSLILCMFLNSCAVVDWFLGKTSDSEVKEMDEDIAKSMSKKTTSYDAALRNFGKMLDAYSITEIRVQSKLISNQTSEKELPDDISRMLISSVNKIGRKVIYVPYDPSYVINEANTGGTINRALPELVIAGGITEFDKDLIEKGRELNAEAAIEEGDFNSEFSHDGGAGYDAKSSISRMTLDLQLLNYRTQAYLSGIQAINSVNLRKSKFGIGVGYFFQGSGLSMQYSLREKQGKYHAIRLLVELSVLEILGKYFDVPYWKCIEGMSPDTGMINRLRDEFSLLSDDQQYSYLKEYMFLHGISGINRKSNFMSASELAKLEKVQKKYNCNNNTDLFIKLWETISIPDAIKRNKEYRHNEARKAEEAAKQEHSKIAKYNALITHADTLYKNKRLSEARSAYQQASIIFPDQRDPKTMIARIDAVSAKQSTETEVTAEPNITKKQPEKSNKNTAEKKNKEAPLNPFKKGVEW